MRQLSSKQHDALSALLISRTHKEAAERAGISTRQLNRYLNNKQFCEAYSRATRKLVDEATRNMQKSLKPALDALIEIVSNPTEQAGARVQASRALLEYTLRYTEFIDILNVMQEEPEPLEVEADVL